MALINMMCDQWLLGVGILLVSAIAFLSINKSGRNAVLAKLYFHHGRTSGSSTPPLSVNPDEKNGYKETGQQKPSNAANQDHSKIFPPSRRCALLELAKTSSTLSQKDIGPDPSSDTLAKNSISITLPYYFQIDKQKYTPTGFSTAEVKAMGDFPAYDILSGVPLPEPYKAFDPAKALPRPYRPFRRAYHQTMSLTKMEPNWWLEIEKNYVTVIKDRKALFEQYGDQLLAYLPGSELACKELMEMCLQFYCARYPSYFSLSPDKRIFHNALLHKDTDIKSMHPLHVLLNNIPEDFGIVLRNEKDGMYYFRAGIICSSLGWNVGTKIGMKLEEIHQPIPDYKEKMAFSMDRYFSKMPTIAPIQRGSWGLEIGEPVFMPPGDPHEKYRDYQKEDLTVEECNLRVDWQTLRRLPLSAAIVFNFSALFTPVKEFRDEPYIPALLVKILKEAKRSLMEYKNTWHVEHVCIPALEEWAEEQVAKGMVKPTEGKETWVVSTLEESPYFPGWEEKWHRQQGY